MKYTILQLKSKKEKHLKVHPKEFVMELKGKLGHAELSEWTSK